MSIGSHLAGTPVGDDGAVRRPRAFTSLHGYQRAWAGADLVAGLTLLVIAVPEQLATSRLAGMPPDHRLLRLRGGHRCSSPSWAPTRRCRSGPTRPSHRSSPPACPPSLSPAPPHYVDLVEILAVMVGLIVMLVSLLRLGWIAEFLSTPIVTGFLSGVAVIIIVHQLPDLLGLPPTGGNEPAPHRLRAHPPRRGQRVDARHRRSVCWPSWSCCARLDRRIPGALIGMVASTALVGALGLQAHGVAVLGTVATGAPHVGLTGLSWSTLRSLAPLAAVVALVVVTQTAATTRAFAEQGGYDVDAGRDFLAVGAGSVVAGLVGSFPVDASPPRTGAVATAGGRTQAGALGAAAGGGPPHPGGGRAGGRAAGDAGRHLDLRGAPALQPGATWSPSPASTSSSSALAAVTLLTVVLVGVEQGIGVAVGLAILDRIRLSARPQLHVLGRVPGHHQLDAALADVARRAESRRPRRSCSPRRSGTPTRCTSARRSPAPSPTPGHDAGPRARHHRDVRRRLHRVAGAGPGVGALRARPRRVRRGPGRGPLRESLRRSGLGARIGEDHFYPTRRRGGHRVGGPDRRALLTFEPRASPDRLARADLQLHPHRAVVRTGVGEHPAGDGTQRTADQDVVDLAVGAPRRPARSAARSAASRG